MRLRYLDFGDALPKTGIIGEARHLGWPVNAYRISLPRTISQDDGLNPFERAVLGIMRADRIRDVTRVADELCLDADFAEGVIVGLQDKGLLDESRRITAEGLGQLDRASEGLELRQAWVFKELVDGNMLPFFYLPRNDNPPRWKDEPHRAKQLSESSARFSMPTPSEVLDVMRETKRRLSNYGHAIRLPKLGQIDVHPNPDKFYLDCPIVMRDSDGRWRIADPFRYGYSTLLERIFLKQMDSDSGLQEWMMRWSDSLVSKIPGPSENTESRLSKEARKAFPGLDENLWTWGGGKRSIGQVYAVLEWTLFYSCMMNGLDDKAAELRFSSAKDQSQMIKRALEEIGGDSQGRVPYVSKEDLRGYLSGSPAMRVVLPMSILQAADDPTHPLRDFCRNNPDFVSRIGRITSRRNAPMHGGDDERVVEPGSPDEVFMKELVTTLIPSISFDSGNEGKAQISRFRSVNYNATNSIMGEFGPSVPYLRMTRGARDALISAERFWLTYNENNNAQPFINELYAALQAALDAEIMSDRVRQPDSSSFDPCRSLLEKAERLNLGALPSGLLKTKGKYVQDALQGGSNHSLGASLIVFISLAEDERLLDIMERTKDFVGFICDLIALRGHGNGMVTKTKEESGRYREETLAVMKAILEV